MERILGLRRAELAKGAGVLWLGRLPDREAFALRAYKQCPGGATYDGHGGYPPGLAAERCCAVSRSAWAASHAQDNPTLPLELKEDHHHPRTDILATATSVLRACARFR